MGGFGTNVVGEKVDYLPKDSIQTHITTPIHDQTLQYIPHFFHFSYLIIHLPHGYIVLPMPGVPTMSVE